MSVRPLLFLGILFVLAAASVSAQLDATLTPVKTEVIPREQAAFDLVIHNDKNVPDEYFLKHNELFWDVSTDPLYEYFSGIEVPAHSTKTVHVFVNQVKPDLDYGRYKVELTLTSSVLSQSTSFDAFIDLRPEKPLIIEYLAAVRRIVEIPDEVNPAQPVQVSINLFNRNPKNLSDVTIVFSSTLINREVHTSLEPLESKQITEVFVFDPLTPPQDDVLTVQLIVDGVVLEPTLREPYVVGAYPNIELVETTSESSFLKTTTSYVYQNTGNVRGAATIEEPVGFFERYFTFTEPESIEIKRDATYLAWELDLRPNESIVLVRESNYRSLLIILVIGALAAIAYYFFRSPLELSKSASVTGMREGGVSDIRVIIRVRNRSGKTYERVLITDKTPMIAHVLPTKEAGSMKPSSIYNDGKRTIVKWEIDSLEKGEEMILSYTMKSRFAIIGSVTLPGVTARFYSKGGTKLLTKSKQVTVKVV